MRSLLVPLLLLSAALAFSHESHRPDLFARQLALDTQAVRDAGYATEPAFTELERLGKRAVVPQVFKYGTTKVRGVSELFLVSGRTGGS